MVLSCWEEHPFSFIDCDPTCLHSLHCHCIVGFVGVSVQLLGAFGRASVQAFGDTSKAVGFYYLFCTFAQKLQVTFI